LVSSPSAPIRMSKPVAALHAQVRGQFATIIDGTNQIVKAATFLDPRTLKRYAHLDAGAITEETREYGKQIIAILDRYLPPPAAAADPFTFIAVPSPTVARELSEYVAAGLKLELTDNFCPLANFWGERARSGSQLAQLARQILSIRPTEAEAERMASLAGMVDTERRNRISAERLRSVVLASAWAKRPSDVSGPQLTKRKVDMKQRVENAIKAAFPEEAAPAHVPAAEPLGDLGADADEGDVHDALLQLDEGLINEAGELDGAAAARALVEADDDEDADAPAAGGAGDAPPPRRVNRLAAKHAVQQSQRGQWGRGYQVR